MLSFELFEGETSFESPVVHLAAGGEFRISRLVDTRGLTDFDNDTSGLAKVDNRDEAGQANVVHISRLKSQS